MKVKYLLHHLGLGDHITCNALVRTLLYRWDLDKLCLFCKRENAWNVQFMYRDEPRIEILPIEKAFDDWQTICRMMVVRGLDPYHTPQDWATGGDGHFFKLGFDALHRLWSDPRNNIRSCDQGFYLQAGVPYKDRFELFHMKRDMEAEEIVRQLHAPAGEYIFIHDYSDAHPIVPSWDFLRTGPKRVINSRIPSVPIMLMGKLLEDATEIHVPNSSIRCLIDTPALKFPSTALYLHNFRGDVGNSMRDWTLVRQDLTTEFVPKCYLT